MKQTKSMYELMKQTVFKYVKSHLDVTDKDVNFTESDVYIVWACKTL